MKPGRVPGPASLNGAPMPAYRIPVVPAAQTLRVQMGTAYYRLAFAFVDEAEGGWFLDLADDDGRTLLAGIPVLPFQDLLEPHAYHGIGVQLIVYTPGAPQTRPTFAGFGSDSVVIFQETA